MELLANGFTVVKREMVDENDAIVLAEHKVRQEFATWVESTYTFWGHYFPYFFPNTTRESAEKEAREDFDKRVAWEKRVR